MYRHIFSLLAVSFLLMGAFASFAMMPPQAPKKSTPPVPKETNFKPNTDEYVMSVLKRLRQDFPDSREWKNLNLAVKLNIRVDEQGRQLEVKIIAPSIRPKFDAQVLAHALKISSFDPPAMALRQSIRKDGIDILVCNTTCP